MSRGPRKPKKAPEPPKMPSLYSEFVLADDSPSGIRWCVAGGPTRVVGTPRELHWPKGAPEGWAGPLSYEMYVQVDQEVFDGGGFFITDPIYEYWPAPVLREILREEAELRREIQLLEQHIQQGTKESTRAAA